MSLTKLLECLFGSPRQDERDAEIRKLKNDLKGLNEKVDLISKSRDKKQDKIDDLKQELDVAEDKIKEMKKDLDKKVDVPDIKSFIEGEPSTKVDPLNMTLFHDYDDKIDLQTSDDNYYAYTKDTWKALLKPIQEEVKQHQGYWRNDIGDCDNFALSMSAIVAMAFNKAKNSKQGAFAYVKGGKTAAKAHAYNGFLTSDDGFYLFEPQDGEIIGKLEEGTDKYETRKVHFLA